MRKCVRAGWGQCQRERRVHPSQPGSQPFSAKAACQAPVARAVVGRQRGRGRREIEVARAQVQRDAALLAPRRVQHQQRLLLAGLAARHCAGRTPPALYRRCASLTASSRGRVRPEARYVTTAQPSIQPSWPCQEEQQRFATCEVSVPHVQSKM